MIMKQRGHPAVEVADFAEASKKYEERRDESGLGASRFPTGAVYEGARKVASISYNGRVWASDRRGPDAVPIYEPHLDQFEGGKSMAPEDVIMSEGIRVPSRTTDMTLDQAIDWMDGVPCMLSAANLLDVATKYHADEMIGDDTYRANVGKASAFLRSRI